MERTKKAKYMICEPSNSSVFSSDSNKRLWFEVLEGEDEGIRVSISIFQNPEFEELLLSLSEGDIVEAVLEREGEGSQWEIDELEVYLRQ